MTETEKKQLVKDLVKHIDARDFDGAYAALVRLEVSAFNAGVDAGVGECKAIMRGEYAATTETLNTLDECRFKLHRKVSP